MAAAIEVVQSDDNQMEAPAEDSSAFDWTRDQVFSNALVWRHLGKYLHFSDLKVLRLVCQEFNRNVMGETDFESRVVITLSGSKIEEEVFEPTTTWKHFKINCFTYEDLYEDCEEESFQEDEVADGNDENESTPDFDWLYLILADAESLIISTKDIETDHGTIFPPLKNLLEAATNLKRLEVDIQLVARSMKNGSMALTSKAYTMLENLSELHILESTEYLLSAELDDIEEEVTDELIMKSIRPLTQLMNNLRALTIENIVAERLSDLSKEMNYYKVKNFLKLITNNRKNLVRLHVDEVLLWYYSKVNFIQPRAITSHDFPNLRSIRIRTHQREHSETSQQNLINFLAAHPLLEEVDITVTPCFPITVLHALHNHTHLKKLFIKTKKFEHEEVEMWSFLSKLSSLRAFRVILSRSFGYGQNACTPQDILIALPTSVTDIALKGFPKSFDLHPGFCSLNESIQMKPMNITSLKLKNCRAFVDNVVVQLICKHFRMLRHLDLSFNRKITDSGVTGSPKVDEFDSEYSLKDLKGLRTLSLASCEHLTDRCTLAIEFLELSFVDLSFNKKITTDGYLHILRHNPSLEVLKTDNSFPTDFSYKNSRFKSIEQQTGSCHDDSDDELTDDSETDISDVEFGDSDFDYDYDYGVNNFFDSDEDDDSLVVLF